MNRIMTTTLFLVCSTSLLRGQSNSTLSNLAGNRSLLLGSNSASSLLLSGDTLWIGSGRGLSFTADGGTTWTNLANTATFDDKAISGLTIQGDEIWAATVYSKTIDNTSYLTGGGLHFSTNHGKSWNFVAQPTDTGKVDTLVYGHNKIPSLAITVTELNVTFDIALTSSSAWIASWYGMLRKSTDHGKTWVRVVLPPDDLNSISPSDTLSFNMSNSQGKLNLGENRNHFVFAVHASSDSLLWVGTAGGVNKSTDGGVSWRKFNHRNQQQAICGDYIAAIREQRLSNRTIIWALCNTGDQSDERRGISYTDNGGDTWKTILFSEFVRDVAFKDSILYIATDGGLYRTMDMGKTFIRAGTVYDPINGQRLTENKVYTVQVKGDTVWAGGSDGVAYTIDSNPESFGARWRIFRTYEPLQNSASTYSYPLPFSPSNEVVRLHYSTQGRTAAVTIRIFDFTMHPVKTLLRNAVRSGSSEHDEIWNGNDDSNRRVANGVYFYRVEIEGSEPIWGKILVLQ
ncbi:MAG: hypothetical protein NTZ35_07310 [Ignavibacteriales bacterium]|nr:hypothetical protein [Ignavibacteriales bacterium]